MKLISAFVTLGSLLIVSDFGHHKAQTAIPTCDSISMVLKERNTKYLVDYKNFTDSLCTVAANKNQKLRKHIREQSKYNK